MVILFSILGWRFLSTLVDTYHKEQANIMGTPYTPRFASYGVSFIHAILTSAGGAYAMAMTPASEEMCHVSEPWRDYLLLCSCGYFLNDLFVELKKDRKNAGMIFHHSFVFTFLFLATQRKMFTHPLAVLLLNEVSTPFLAVRWNMKRIESFRELTPNEKRLDFLNGLSLIATFGLFRIALIPVVWLQVFQAGCLDPALGNSDLVSSVMIWCGNINFPVLWAMNLYWYNIMVKQAMNVLLGKNGEKGNTQSTAESDKLD